MPHSVAQVSENQKGLYFIHQISGADAANNLPGAVILKGELDIIRLQAAVERIIREQASLRMSFHLTAEGLIEMHIQDETAYTVVQEELPQGQDEAADTSRIDELIFAEAARPFDLKKAPLFRLRIIKTTALRHILLLTMHHIISDGWSLEVFKENLLRYYNDPDAPAALRKNTYLEYVKDEETLLQSGQGKLLKDYWMKKLSGVVPMEIPTDFPRSAVKNYEGERVGFELPDGAVAELKKFARAQRVTPFMVLFSAFQLLMRLQSGMNDLVIATPVAGRLKTEYEGLIGFYVNNLPMRACIDPENTVREFLQANRKTIVEAYRNQQYPYSLMVKDLGLFTSLEKFPLSDVSFGFDVINQDSIASIRLSGLETEEIEQKKISVPGELLMFMVEGENRMMGNVEYNSSLFTRSTVLSLIRHYLTMIGNLLANPDVKIKDLSILDAEELRRVCSFSHGETVPYACGGTYGTAHLRDLQAFPGKNRGLLQKKIVQL